MKSINNSKFIRFYTQKVICAEQCDRFPTYSLPSYLHRTVFPKQLLTARVLVPLRVRQKSRIVIYDGFWLFEMVAEGEQKGNSENTIKFLEYLRSQRPEAKLLIIWDGASYHRSQQIKDYLDSLNHGLKPEECVYMLHKTSCE